MSTNEQSLKSAIGNFLKTTRLAGKLAEQKVIDGWEARMGKMINSAKVQVEYFALRKEAPRITWLEQDSE